MSKPKVVIRKRSPPLTQSRRIQLTQEDTYSHNAITHRLVEQARNSEEAITKEEEERYRRNGYVTENGRKVPYETREGSIKRIETLEEFDEKFLSLLDEETRRKANELGIDILRNCIVAIDHPDPYQRIVFAPYILYHFIDRKEKEENPATPRPSREPTSASSTSSLTSMSKKELEYTEEVISYDIRVEWDDLEEDIFPGDLLHSSVSKFLKFLTNGNFIYYEPLWYIYNEATKLWETRKDVSPIFSDILLDVLEGLRSEAEDRANLISNHAEKQPWDAKAKACFSLIESAGNVTYANKVAKRSENEFKRTRAGEYIDVWDKKNPILSLQNGRVLDLKKWMIRPRRRDDFLTDALRVTIPDYFLGDPDDETTLQPIPNQTPVNRVWFDDPEEELFEESDDPMDMLYGRLLPYQTLIKPTPTNNLEKALFLLDDFISKISLTAQVVNNPVLRQARKDYLIKLMGYFCTGDTDIKSLFILYGPSRDNAKSTFTNLLKKILGPKYYATIQKETLLVGRRSKGTHTADINWLKGKYLGVAPEFDQQDQLSAEIIKKIVGKDGLVGRGAYEQRMDDFETQIKILIHTNSLPEMKMDANSRDKVRVISFESRFVDNPDPTNPLEFLRDPSFGDIFEREEVREAGFLIAMSGYHKLKMEGERVPDDVINSSTEYVEEDDLNELLSQCLAPSDDKVKLAEVKVHLSDWSNRLGYYGFSKYWKTNKILQKELETRGYKVTKPQNVLHLNSYQLIEPEFQSNLMSDI